MGTDYLSISNVFYIELILENTLFSFLMNLLATRQMFLCEFVVFEMMKSGSV